MNISSPDKEVLSLVFAFSQALERRAAHLQSFCRHGVQVEGWLKGELLGFLDEQKRQGKIVDFGREEKVLSDKRKRVDFKLALKTETGTRVAWIEIKHWLIGQQKGATYGSSFYFGDPSSVGIGPDVRKLAIVPNDGKYLLVLAIANPGDDEWQRGVTGFNKKFDPLRVETLNRPGDFPGHFYLGLLKVS
jgi:hypothetical protein